MPAPACSAPIAPTLTIRPAAGTSTRCGDRRPRRIQRGQHVERIHALPGFRVALGDRLERKAAGDIDQRIQLAEMRRDGVDGLLGLRGVGKIDAAEFDAVGRRRDLRRRVIDAGDPRAPRQRRFRDHLAERAQGAGHDNDFSVHDGSPQVDRAAHTIARRNSFAMLHKLCFQMRACDRSFPQRMFMPEIPRPCDQPPRHSSLSNIRFRIWRRASSASAGPGSWRSARRRRRARAISYPIRTGSKWH